MALRIKSCDDVWWQRWRTRINNLYRSQTMSSPRRRFGSLQLHMHVILKGQGAPFCNDFTQTVNSHRLTDRTDYPPFGFYFIGYYIILENAQVISCSLNAPCRPKGSEYSHPLLKMQSASMPLSNRITLFSPVIAEPQFSRSMCLLISSSAWHKAFHHQGNQLFYRFSSFLLMVNRWQKISEAQHRAGVSSMCKRVHFEWSA